MGETNKKDTLLIIVGICAFIIVITVFVDFIRVNNKVSEIREQMNEVCEKYLSCPDYIQEEYEEQIKEIKLGKSFLRLLVQIVFYAGIGLLCFSYVGSNEMEVSPIKNDKNNHSKNVTIKSILKKVENKDISKEEEFQRKLKNIDRSKYKKLFEQEYDEKLFDDEKSDHIICNKCGKELFFLKNDEQRICPWCGAKVK